MPRTPPSPGLTVKREIFVQAFVETGNASKAYRHAYDVRETTKPESVWQSASKLLADLKVASRVVELQSDLRFRHDVTVDALTAEFDENRALALETSQPAAANGATMGKARLHGLDKGAAALVEVNTRITVLSDLEVARRLAFLLEKGANGRAEDEAIDRALRQTLV